MNVTPCQDCDNVHSDTRKLAPRQWVCIRFPRLPGLNSVAPTVWTDREPFMRCVGINGGFCPLFVKRRDGQKDNGL